VRQGMSLLLAAVPGGADGLYALGGPETIQGE
jgi:hypothetical protein